MCSCRFNEKRSDHGDKTEALKFALNFIDGSIFTNFIKSYSSI